MPRNTRLEARVARNEWTRKATIMHPFRVPRTSPTMGPRTRPVSGSTLTASHAAVTAATPKIAPVERSKPPPMMTRVRALAMIASGAFWLRMFSRLRGVRNASLMRVRPIITARIMTSTA